MIGNVNSHTICEIAIGSKLGIDATKKRTCEGFNLDTCVGALIKMDTAARPAHRFTPHS